MVKAILIFESNEFHKKLEDAINKSGKQVNLSQVKSGLFFKGFTSIPKSTVFFFNKKNIDENYGQLLLLSVFNVMVFVSDREDQIIEDKKLEAVFDLVVSHECSYPQLYTMLIQAIRLINTAIWTNSGKNHSSNISGVGGLITEKVPLGFFIKDENLTYFTCNQQFATDFGFDPPSSVYGKSDFDFLNEKDALQFSAYDSQLLKNDETVISFDKEIGLKSGEKAWLRISKFPLTDRTGKPHGIIGFYQNITDNIGVEETLKSNQHFLQILMDNIPDTIYFKDRESRFVKINKAQVQLLGAKSQEDAIGKTDFDFFNHEHARKAFSDEQRIMLDGTMVVNQEEKILLKEGGYKWMTSTKVPIVDHNGISIGTVGITRDVTDYYNNKENLKQERDLLQTIIDHIPSFIYVKDTESRFTHANIAKVKSMGVDSPSVLKGKTEFDFLSEEQARAAFADETEILTTGIPLINKIEKLVTSKNKVKWISSTKVPYRNEKSQILGLVCISHDITDQVIAREKLELAIQKAEEASKAKSHFLSNMSHEIRTPMNGVIGMSEVLGTTELTEEQRMLNNYILKSGNSLLSIINDILDFSRIESGKIDLEMIPFVVQNVVEDTIEQLAAEAREKNIFLKLVIGHEIPTGLIGYAFRLKQVLINLTNNAVKFTKEGGVTISVIQKERKDDHLSIEFRVSDSGIGIAKENIERLFEPFTQVDASTSRRYGGTGLGLAISSMLVDKMGGRLQVVSEEGVGSTFFFSLRFKVADGKVEHKPLLKWSL